MTAYRVTITCQGHGCKKPATCEVYTRENVLAGRFCGHCGIKVLNALLRQEATT